MSHVGAPCKGEEMVHFPISELPSGFPAFLAPPSNPSNPTLTQSPGIFFLRRLQSSDPFVWGGVEVSVQGGEQGQGQERGWPLSIHILSVTKTRKHAEVQSHHLPTRRSLWMMENHPSTWRLKEPLQKAWKAGCPQRSHVTPLTNKHGQRWRWASRGLPDGERGSLRECGNNKNAEHPPHSYYYINVIFVRLAPSPTTPQAVHRQ